jgi:aspartate carbamoyltransferase catalytic subunit
VGQVVKEKPEEKGASLFQENETRRKLSFHTAPVRVNSNEVGKNRA